MLLEGLFNVHETLQRDGNVTFDVHLLRSRHHLAVASGFERDRPRKARSAGGIALDVIEGKGCGPRAFREFEKGNVHLGAIIKKDREAGFPEPQRILVAENLTENEAFDREMQEIALHRRTKDGGTLTNMTDGGPGREVEAELRRRLKALGKYRRLHVANSQRPAVLDYEECRRQCNINAKSGHGVVPKTPVRTALDDAGAVRAHQGYAAAGAVQGQSAGE